mgnify:CR=1 FL=1
MPRNVNNPGYVIVFATVVSAVFTAGIMALHAVTEPVMIANEQAFNRKALVEIFYPTLVEKFGLEPKATFTNAQVNEIYKQHIRKRPGPDGNQLLVQDPQTGTEFAVYEAFGGEGAGERVVGYAFPISGVGFWNVIDGYLAVNKDRSRILGITFTKHQETPGLGGRITEPAWRDRFEGLDITPPVARDDPQGSAEGTPAYIYIGKQPPPGGAGNDRFVETITGATGTSTAVAKFLNDDIAQFRRAADAANLPKE